MNQYEKSSRRSWSKVKLAMFPFAGVVRSTVASWQTTSSPSKVACTSSSIPVAPDESARAMAKIVDEGDSHAPPWWAYAISRRSNQTDASFTDVIDRKSTRLNSSHLGISYA